MCLRLIAQPSTEMKRRQAITPPTMPMIALESKGLESLDTFARFAMIIVGVVNYDTAN